MKKAQHICEGENVKGKGLFGVNKRCLIMCGLLHYLLSAFVGLLVFWLTSTILLHVTSSSGKIWTDSCINMYSFLVSLPFASLVHCLEDMYWGKF